MKAALALIVIYVGMFFVAIQGGSPGAVQAAAQSPVNAQGSTKTSNSIDPVKDADIRALLELVGARDQVHDSVHQIAEQYREKLLATVPSNEKGQAFVNTTINEYEKRYDVDKVNEQLVVLYDKHYTDDDIKTLLQFYGSPVGQKVAAETPKIAHEIQAASRTAGTKAAKEALQEMREQNPQIGQYARLGNGQRRWQQGARGQQSQSQQAAQQPDPPQL